VNTVTASLYSVKALNSLFIFPSDGAVQPVVWDPNNSYIAGTRTAYSHSI
jgi:hypothetical protein